MKVKITHDIGLRKTAYDEMLTILEHTVFDDNEYEIACVGTHYGNPSSNDSTRHRVPCTERDVYIEEVGTSIYFRVLYSTDLSCDGSITGPFFRAIYIKEVRVSNDPTASAQIAEPSVLTRLHTGYNSIFSDYYWADTTNYTTYRYGYANANGGVFV